MNISIIVAIARNHGIGFENKLLYFKNWIRTKNYLKDRLRISYGQLEIKSRRFSLTK